MLIDAGKYLWRRCPQENIPIPEGSLAAPFDPPLRIYRFSAEGFNGTLSIYEEEGSKEPVYSGPLPYEPEVPVACDGLFFSVQQEDKGETPVTLRLLAESGVKKDMTDPPQDITESFGYLIRQGETFYTVADGQLKEIEVKDLSAAVFLEHGFTENPPSGLLAGLESPHIYRWQSDHDSVPLKARLKAYPHPQTLSVTADMSHVSILGIKLMTAEYSDSVGVSYSTDGETQWSEEAPLGEWLNTDPEDLWNSLGEKRLLHLRFILHGNAELSRFKITYIN